MIETRSRTTAGLRVREVALIAGLACAGWMATSSPSGAEPMYVGGAGTETYDRAPHNRSFDHGHTFTEQDDDLYTAAPPEKKPPQRNAYKSRRHNNTYQNDGYVDDEPYAGSLKDSPLDHERAQYPRARDYGHVDRNYGEDRHARRHAWRDRAACAPRRYIRRQLRRAGWRGFWRDFRRGRRDGRITYARARQRGTGDRYELAIDRCSGEVVSAEFISGPNRRWHRRGLPFDDYRGDIVLRW